ncbi:MAG: hypothetical protein U0Z75_02775 [Deinococcaceae bacterium]
MKSVWIVVLLLSCGNTLAMSGMGFQDEPLAVCDTGGSTIHTGPEVIGNPSGGLSTVETAEDGTVRVQQQPVEP